MIYQLAKTSVGLSGQVKWDMIINASKVVDLQIVPIHEDIPFNYDDSTETLNYTHTQNIKRLFNKIPSQFYESVIKPSLCTGYPVSNNGIRVETHEHSYEMGMKRNSSYQRYGKQFSFFCPVWCDDPNELKNIEFRLIIENDPKNVNNKILFEQVIDHSYIKKYLEQYIDSIHLNSDLAYISFSKNESWISGVDISTGSVRKRNTVGLIHDLTSQERPMMEMDNMLLNQFEKRKLVASQLFNFNFEFNIGDFIPPSLLHDVAGDMVNVYVDCYVKTDNGDVKVPFKDLYSNYEMIPKYDIVSGRYVGTNCLDYLKDPSNINILTQNKLVQSTFHWALQENPKYLFNLYDGCCPIYIDKKKTYQCHGMFFDVPDTSSRIYDKMKNPLGWVKPIVTKSQLNEDGIVETVLDVIDGKYPNNGISFEKQDTEFFWRNNIKFSSKLKSETSDEIKRLKKLKVYLVYCPKATFDRENIKNSFEKNGIKDVFADPIVKPAMYYAEHFITTDENIISQYKKRPKLTGISCYTIVSPSELNGDLDTLIFLLPDNRQKPSDNYLDNEEWDKWFMISNIVKGFKNNPSEDFQKWTDSLTVLTNRSMDYSCIDDEYSDPYKFNTYGCEYGLNQIIKTFMRSAIRTIVDNLSNIIQPEVITMTQSIISDTVDRPNKIAKWANYKGWEHVYYKSDKFTYLCRYDGRLNPLFIDGTDKNMYNFVYVVKQYNTYTNEIECSDKDMVDFNTYANTGFSPLYPSLNFFPIRKKKCNYSKYHRGSRRYYWERSWYKKNAFYILPEHLEFKKICKEITEEDIYSMLWKFIEKNLTWRIKGNKTLKKKLIFDNFIFPLYDYSYTSDYKDNKTYDKYIFHIKYTLK